MTFPVLAFFSRTMRVQARSSRTYAFRGTLALLLWTMLGFSHAARLGSNAPGLQFFRALISTNLWVLCTVALVYFATAITEEKEEMTLGLLKLAGLNPLSILMGKSTSRLLGMGMLLLVQVPFAVLAVTLGGVSIDQVLAAYLMLLAFTWFLCNLALLCSVVAPRSRSGAALAGFLFIAFLLLPLAIQGASSLLIHKRMLVDGGAIAEGVAACCASMVDTSPFTRYGEIMRIGFAGPIIGHQAIASLIWGLGFFLLSWALFGPCTRRQKRASPARGLIPKSGFLLRPLGVGRTWRHALAWKEFHFMAGGKIQIIVKAVLFALAVVVTGALAYGIDTEFGIKRGRADWNKVRDGTGVMLTVGILLITALEMGVHASRIFSSEVKWKTLSGVMGLPISVGRFVWDKIRGCALTLLPNLVLLLVALILGSETIGEVLRDLILSEEEAFAGCLYVVSQFLLFLNLTAFLSLYVKWGAFVLAAMVQLVAQQIVGMLFAFLVMSGSGGGEGAIVGFMMFMVLLSLGLAFLFGFLTTVRLTKLAGTEA